MKKITAVHLVLLAFFIFPVIGHSAFNEGDPEMTENKEIVTSFFENVTAGDIDGAFELVSDEVSWWVPGTLPFSGTKTKSEYMAIVGQITKGFPTGFELKVTGMIEENDQVAAEVISNGTHMNGRQYNNRYHFLIRIKDSKMVDVKEYMDTLHLHQLIAPKSE